MFFNLFWLVNLRSKEGSIYHGCSCTLLITEVVDWVGGKLIPWPCIKTLLSHSSCKSDNQWALEALVLWIFWLYWDQMGSTVTPLSWTIWDLEWSWEICWCWGHSGKRLRDTRVTGEKSLMTSLEHNSCRTKTTHDKKKKAKSGTDVFGFFWGYRTAKRYFLLWTLLFFVYFIPLQTAWWWWWWWWWRNSSF